MALISRFWGRDLDYRPDAVDSSDQLITLSEVLLAGEALTDNRVTLRVVKGLCTAALASAPVTMY